VARSRVSREGAKMAKRDTGSGDSVTGSVLHTCKVLLMAMRFDMHSFRAICWGHGLPRLSGGKPSPRAGERQPAVLRRDELVRLRFSREAAKIAKESLRRWGSARRGGMKALRNAGRQEGLSVDGNAYSVRFLGSWLP